MERAVALSAGRAQVEIGDLPSEIQQASQPVPLAGGLALPDEGVDFERFIADIEREMIRRSLERTHGNKGAAARLLNLKRTTLVEKLKRLERS
jgi:DNA-binding NtrC family response regulator